MNKVIISGNLTRDVMVSESQNGMKVARGSVALDRGKDKNGESKGADFPNIVAFDKKAEFLGKYGKQGRRFMIEGHIQTGKYDKEGVTVYTTDVIIDRIEFADSKPADAEPEPEFVAVADTEATELPFN